LASCSSSRHLLVFQLRAIDLRRVQEKIGKLEPVYLDQFDTEHRSLLGL